MRMTASFRSAIVWPLPAAAARRLFVSLHADSLSGEGDVRGASVYTLSDRASDADAARAAEKENRADLMAGLDAGEDKREGVEDILFDLARRETRIFSQIVARNAASAIQKGARLHKSPLRSAGFRVLRAPDMPSILVELGYLSNAEDLAVLASESSREKLGAGLGEALVRFMISGRDAISTKSTRIVAAPNSALKASGAVFRPRFRHF